MNAIRKRRLLFIGILTVSSFVVASLVILALRENINLFYSPSQVVKGEVKKGIRIRVGGMVKPGSVIRGEELNVQFVLIDFPKNSVSENQLLNELEVNFTGILPDLFKEGQGIVTTGELSKNSIFRADEVLAKHDENYRPPELTYDP